MSSAGKVGHDATSVSWPQGVHGEAGNMRIGETLRETEVRVFA